MESSRKQKRLEFFLISMIFVLSIFYGFTAFCEEAKILRLDEKTTAKVLISSRGTVLNFPIKPTKVILGRSGSFGIEYVENDLAISPLSMNAHSNLFVYIYGRRFSFDLIAAQQGNAVIRVLDAIEPGNSNLKSQKAKK